MLCQSGPGPAREARIQALRAGRHFWLLLRGSLKKKFRSSSEFFTFYVRSLNHETFRAKSFTGCRRHFVAYAYVFKQTAHQSGLHDIFSDATEGNYKGDKQSLHLHSNTPPLAQWLMGCMLQRRRRLQMASHGLCWRCCLISRFWMMRAV